MSGSIECNRMVLIACSQPHDNFGSVSENILKSFIFQITRKKSYLLHSYGNTKKKGAVFDTKGNNVYRVNGGEKKQ